MARTNIVIDDKLIRQVVKLTGARSKRQAVDIALQKLIKQADLYERFRKLEGKLNWEGDLKALRKSRV